MVGRVPAGFPGAIGTCFRSAFFFKILSRPKIQNITMCVPINGDARRRTEIIINDTGFRKAGIQKRTGIVLGKAKMGKTMANLLKSPARREGENTEGVGIVHGNHYSGFV